MRKKTRKESALLTPTETASEALRHSVPLLNDPVQSLLARLTPDAPRILIALAGLPGSGKSTLAARMAARVNAQAGAATMAVLGMDGFHLTRDALRHLPDPESALVRRGAPWTFDATALAARLRRVRSAGDREAIPWPEFRHERGDPVEGAQVVLPESRLILVEGLYLCCRDEGWGEVSALFDERWYLDTPPEVAWERLTDRHMSVWGLTRKAAEARIAVNDRFNAEIVSHSRAFADKLVAD